MDFNGSVLLSYWTGVLLQLYM